MLTVTDLVTYTFCPRKLYAMKKLGFREPKSGEMALGTVVHEACEWIMKDLTAGRSLSTSDVSKLFSRVLLKRKSLLKETGWQLMECFRAGRDHVVSFSKDRARVISDGTFSTVEVEVALESKRLGLKGRIDELRVARDGGVVPVELKTGSAPQSGMFDYHMLQLSAYALMLREVGRDAKRVAVWYTGDAILRELCVEEFHIQRVRDVLDQAMRMLKVSIMPDAGCGECEVCQVALRSHATDVGSSTLTH